jgi:hypothetical protein
MIRLPFPSPDASAGGTGPIPRQPMPGRQIGWGDRETDLRDRTANPAHRRHGEAGHEGWRRVGRLGLEDIRSPEGGASRVRRPSDGIWAAGRGLMDER